MVFGVLTGTSRFRWWAGVGGLSKALISKEGVNMDIINPKADKKVSSYDRSVEKKMLENSPKTSSRLTILLASYNTNTQRVHLLIVCLQL